MTKEIKVTLIDCTGKNHPNPDRYAACCLVFAKTTRLSMEPEGFYDIMALPTTALLIELSKVANTIPSSWEFVDYTFLIQNVTRAFTHQLVRSRHFSFAQQAMRVVDMTGWDYATGPTLEKNPEVKVIYDECMDYIDQAYTDMLKRGIAHEDARGVLPTNIKTNILCKMNLRAFTETYRKRSSLRVQDEYRTVLEQMKAEAMAVHPWLAMFVDRQADENFHTLEHIIVDQIASKEQRDKALKLLFQLRQEI